MLNLISLPPCSTICCASPLSRKRAAPTRYRNRCPTAGLPRLLDWIDPNLRVHAGHLPDADRGRLRLVAAVPLEDRLRIPRQRGQPRCGALCRDEIGPDHRAAMATAGALAGLAGAARCWACSAAQRPGFSAGIGFDAIALALLGRSHPVGILFAGLLFGGLEAGGSADAGRCRGLDRPDRHHPGADHRLHRRAASGAGDLSHGALPDHDQGGA
jgi:hypothetical protein